MKKLSVRRKWLLSIAGVGLNLAVLVVILSLPAADDRPPRDYTNAPVAQQTRIRSDLTAADCLDAAEQVVRPKALLVNAPISGILDKMEAARIGFRVLARQDYLPPDDNPEYLGGPFLLALPVDNVPLVWALVWAYRASSSTVDVVYLDARTGAPLSLNLMIRLPDPAFAAGCVMSQTWYDTRFVSQMAPRFWIALGALLIADLVILGWLARRRFIGPRRHVP